MLYAFSTWLVSEYVVAEDIYNSWDMQYLNIDSYILYLLILLCTSFLDHCAHLFASSKLEQPGYGQLVEVL